MNDASPSPQPDDPRRPDIFDSARWYELGINWEARLAREIPLLREVFGPPGAHGLLDAGCGPGRHVAVLAAAGYHVTGLDRSEGMLAVARAHVHERGLAARWIAGRFDELDPHAGPFDGAYCLGNSLAAAGSAEAIAAALQALSAVLRPGGRFFVQVLNFAKLRAEQPPVRGPRVRRDGAREYISTRVYTFHGREVEVVNVTLWNDGAWRQSTHAGRLYALEVGELDGLLAAAALRVEAQYGNYAKAPFDPDQSDDLIVVAVKG